MAPADPFREISGGRSWFRVSDLLELVGLLKINAVVVPEEKRKEEK
jgi:hypothetical protein